jgi:hypothetical protein
MKLSDIIGLLSLNEKLNEISLDQLLLFIRACQLSRPTLEFETNNLQFPPAILPPFLCKFMTESLGGIYDTGFCQNLWAALRNAIWALPANSEVSGDDDELAFRYNKICLPFMTCE